MATSYSRLLISYGGRSRDVHYLDEKRYLMQSLRCIVSACDGALASPPVTCNDNRLRGSYLHLKPSNNALSSSYTLPIARDVYCGSSTRFTSSYQHIQEYGHPSPIAHLEYRVSELENVSQHQGLTKKVLQSQIWPLLNECASITSLVHPSDKVGHKRNTMSMQQERLDRAKLCSRLLELCLREVEARRVFLWEWLEKLDDESATGNDDNGENNFSPNSFWDDTPHPQTAMFSVVVSAWKHVIESCSSFSIKSIGAMDLMESSAEQVSSLLTLMEDEHSSDLAFVDAYNSTIPTDRYTVIQSMASIPDVKSYSDVIGTWGQCIDGSVLRLPERRGGKSHHPNPSGDAFQKRLQLEATAMKAMMKLLESMEADYYGHFNEDQTNDGNKGSQTKRSAPDRVCYNIILASMARQVNPSLYEMRLVLQRMMERVQYELEQADNDGVESSESQGYAMSFFPDVFSYNALIDARANRSAMFASDDKTKQKRQQHSRKSTSQPQLQRHSVWQQAQGSNNVNVPLRRRKFMSSEEEVLLAEQILYEMSKIVTVSVRPNIYSYNAVIKGWLKSESERGLQRAVMILRSLALNGHTKPGENGHETDSATANGDNADEDIPSVFGRIASWGASLLGKDKAKENRGDGSIAKPVDTANSLEGKKPSTNQTSIPSSGPPPTSFISVVSATEKDGRSECVMKISPMVVGWVVGKGGKKLRGTMVASGAGIRIDQESMGKNEDRIVHITGSKSSVDSAVRMVKRLVKKAPVVQTASAPIINVGRMAFMNSAFQGNIQREQPGPEELTQEKTPTPEPIGLRLPNIEPSVTPDLKTFMLVINALGRLGTASSAKMADDVLHLLEEYYFDLNPDIKIYHSVLNAWARACKETSSVESSMSSAQKADELLRRLLSRDNIESGVYPEANEYTFLMVINAWANAASTAVTAGDVPGGNTAAAQAAELLKIMQQQSLNPNKTTIACYGAVIRTWASLGEAERAQALLEEMVEISERLPLDLIHFNAVLDAWAQDLSSTKSVVAALPKLANIRELLIKMSSGVYNIDPDISSFNHVIRACYAPWSTLPNPVGDDKSVRQQALETAYDVYSTMSQTGNHSHHPDAHTYSHMFKAIACLLPSTDSVDSEIKAEKYNLCKTIFHSCCEEGHLAKSTLFVLRKTLTEDDFVEILLSQMDNHDVKKEKILSIPEDSLFKYLPSDWSRKAHRLADLSKHRQ